MKIVNNTLFWLHIIVGFGGLAGGLAAITDPTSPMGMPVESLKNSPFNDFLIPGIILFGFIGIGNLIAALLFKLKPILRGYAGGVMGGGLAIWIVVQCIMLRAVVALHVIFFAIGMVQAGAAVIILYDCNLFPLSIIRKIIKK